MIFDDKLKEIIISEKVTNIHTWADADVVIASIKNLIKETLPKKLEKGFPKDVIKNTVLDEYRNGYNQHHDDVKKTLGLGGEE